MLILTLTIIQSVIPPRHAMATPSVTEIAQDGDVILVVGPSKRKLWVSSTFLKNASPYFRTLFGPHFSEGQGLGSGINTTPKEIPMPEDSADALEVICNIVHLRNDMIPEKLSPDEAFEIAVAADKFDCKTALKLAIQLWFDVRSMGRQGDMQVLGKYMAAAYILDIPSAFSDITKEMITRCEGSYLPLIDEALGLTECVPFSVICEL